MKRYSIKITAENFQNLAKHMSKDLRRRVKIRQISQHRKGDMRDQKQFIILSMKNGGHFDREDHCSSHLWSSCSGIL
jgi:hypothetical protein